AAVRPSRAPSPQARAMFQQATGPDALETLTKIIDDSPGYIEAAAALVAVGGSVPEKTVQALWSDGAGLLELAAQVRRAGAPPSVGMPWGDRAGELGAVEARFARAGLRLEPAQGAGAPGGPRSYAAPPRPQHPAAARTL